MTLSAHKFSVNMKDVDNRIFTFSSECLLNNNVKQQSKHTVSLLLHIFQNCKGCSCNNCTFIVKNAEGKLRTIQAHLKDELIRVRLHNDNHDESKRTILFEILQL